MFLDSLEDLPPPLSIDRIFREVVEDEECLSSFGPERIKGSIVCFEKIISAAIEAHNFRGKARGTSGVPVGTIIGSESDIELVEYAIFYHRIDAIFLVHLIASIRELLSSLEVPLRLGRVQTIRVSVSTKH